MKKIILLFSSLFLFGYTIAQENQPSYATTFFNNKIQRSYGKKFDGKLLCQNIELDSILKSTPYYLARIYDTIPFFDNTSSLILRIENRNDIEWSKADKNCEYQNNIIVVFKKKDDKFILDVIIQSALNQGIMALDFIDVKMKGNRLFLYQYGGNRFGTWGTEMEFENSQQGWLLTNSKLFTTVDNLNNKFDKLIWSKKATNKLPINEVCFTDIFAPQELEWVLDGVYSE